MADQSASQLADQSASHLASPSARQLATPSSSQFVSPLASHSANPPASQATEASGSQVIAHRLQEQEDEDAVMFQVMGQLQRHCVFCTLICGENGASETEEEPHTIENCKAAEARRCGMKLYNKWWSRIDLKGLKHCYKCGLPQSVCRFVENGSLCEFPKVIFPGLFVLRQCENLETIVRLVGFQGEYEGELWGWMKRMEQGEGLEWESNLMRVWRQVCIVFQAVTATPTAAQPIGLVDITEAEAEGADDGESKLDRQQERRWGQQQVVTRRREEGVAVKELREQLEEWVGGCPLCRLHLQHVAAQGQGQGQGQELSQQGHQLEQCPRPEAEGIQQEAARLMEEVKYERFSSCYYCGVPQAICEQWVQKGGQGWWEKDVNGSC